MGSTAAVSMSCSRVRNEGPATSSRSIINRITVSARSGSKATILSYTFSITVSIRLSSSFIAHLQRRKTCSSVSGHCRTLLRIAVKYSRPNAAVLLVGRWPRRIRLICSGSRGLVFRNSERGLGQACCRGKGFLSPRSGRAGRSLWSSEASTIVRASTSLPIQRNLRRCLRVRSIVHWPRGTSGRNFEYLLNSCTPPWKDHQIKRYPPHQKTSAAFPRHGW